MRQANTDKVPVATGVLTMFVYGTLKRGYWNHDTFCRTALCTGEAAVWGRLYELPSQIPVLQVPDSSIIVVGTSDPLADVATQHRFSAGLTTDTICDETCWQMIRGELVTFPDPRLSLPPIDGLEGFRPGLPSLYHRVLVPVMLDNDRRIAAWCYMGDERTIRHAVLTGKMCWP